MCGIAGVFGRQAGLNPSIVEGVRRMTEAQVHRGPDAQGLLKKEELVLGHRRLSIVDLSEAGKQPMCNEDGTIWVAYNGEIYNFQELRRELQRKGHCFRSSSDTEVLIHGYEEWGIEGLLRRLRGMFAFALYDGRPQARHSENSPGVLLLARDRFGIKPLYYAFLEDRKQLIFASEVRALRQSGLVPTEENTRAWLGFLLFGSVPAPWTTLRAVEVLLPGHYLVADGSRVRTVRYYDRDGLFTKSGELWNSKVVDGQAKSIRSEDGIRELLEETVALHLISDAPLGVFLSGGIDSSALVALAACRKKDLITLGVIFDEKDFSEEAYQRAVAERFRTRHHSIRVTRKDFEDELEKFFQAMDQPTVDGLNTYFIARAAKQVGLKAVLSGIGGDEVFCGYPTLRRAPLLWRLHKLPSSLRKAVVAIGSRRPSLRKLTFLKQSHRLSFYLVQRGLFTPREAAQLLGTEEREAWELIEALEPADSPRNPMLLQQFLEARHYLVDQLLKDADVFGMTHSVEIRVPFLDHVLVEQALNLPLSLKLDSYWPKPFLTRPLRDLLPREVIFRPKQGFTFPIGVWLRLSDNILQIGDAYGLNAHFRKVWEEFLSGRAHWSRAWALTVLRACRLLSRAHTGRH